MAAVVFYSPYSIPFEYSIRVGDYKTRVGIETFAPPSTHTLRSKLTDRIRDDDPVDQDQVQVEPQQQQDNKSRGGSPTGRDHGPDEGTT